ncbi:MAG: hypothetical protein H6714_05895 [Myxococcales bacterium]|nr:hypothetical protein [Myxococcales bacterium]
MLWCRLAIVVCVLGGVTCSIASEQSSSASVSYYVDRLACRPWGLLEGGQPNDLSFPFQLAMAAFVPEHLGRCARHAARLITDNTQLTQDFGAVFPTLTRNAQGYQFEFHPPTNVRQQLLEAIARFHGLPFIIPYDRESPNHLSPAFASLVRQWSELHPDARFEQIESLGHRYLFVYIYQPVLLGGGASELSEAQVAAYVDCDINRKSPGCFIGTDEGGVQLAGIQPVSWDTDFTYQDPFASPETRELSFYPRLSPRHAVAIEQLKPVQRRRLILALTGVQLLEIARLENVDSTSVVQSLDSAFVNLGIKDPSDKIDLRTGAGKLLGTDFQLLEHLLRASPELIQYHGTIAVRVSADDVLLVRLLQQGQSKEIIAKVFNEYGELLRQRIANLRKRLGLSVTSANTREQDMQLIVRLHDIALNYLPYTQPEIEQDVNSSQGSPGRALQEQLNVALSSQPIRAFLSKTRGSPLQPLLGAATNSMTYNAGGITQRFEHAEVHMDANGNFNLNHVVRNFRSELTANMPTAGNSPRVIEVDASVSTPASLQLKPWLDDFRPWIAAWSNVGIAASSKFAEVYGHLFYFSGPVALVHCGYNPYSPGCACGDNGVVPLQLDAPNFEALPQAARDLLAQLQGYNFAFILPYTTFGFPDPVPQAYYGSSASAPSRWSLDALRKLGMASRMELLRHVFELNLRDLTPGIYQIGGKRLDLNPTDVMIIKRMARGELATHIFSSSLSSIFRLYNQLGTSALSSHERLMLEVNYLIHVCGSKVRERNGGVFSGSGAVEPWDATLSPSHAPLLRLDEKRGALTPSGEYSEGQPTTVWATWQAPGVPGMMALVGATLEQPRFIDIQQLMMGRPSAALPWWPPSTVSAKTCPLWSPAGPRFAADGSASWNTEALPIAMGSAYSYVIDGAFLHLVSRACGD